ncbi:turripeptide Lol9.1-like isoform X2 [Macrobrachium nipponense]|uniref:turripeptide Lol9.1-like isoform X2 n=1 Tax=Macrobrachium nipponense TaxID=159736 RepID=UPI0030C81316
MVKKGLPTTMFCVVLLVIIGTSVASPSHSIRCERGCGFNLDFVCGSDGENYANPCVFGIEQCRNPRLRERCKGRCEECD